MDLRLLVVHVQSDLGLKVAEIGQIALLVSAVSLKKEFRKGLMIGGEKAKPAPYVPCPWRNNPGSTRSSVDRNRC